MGFGAVELAIPDGKKWVGSQNLLMSSLLRERAIDGDVVLENA